MASSTDGGGPASSTAQHNTATAGTLSSSRDVLPRPAHLTGLTPHVAQHAARSPALAIHPPPKPSTPPDPGPAPFPNHRLIFLSPSPVVERTREGQNLDKIWGVVYYFCVTGECMKSPPAAVRREREVRCSEMPHGAWCRLPPHMMRLVLPAPGRFQRLPQGDGTQHY